MLALAALDDASAEPALFELSQFRRLAGNAYGGPGPQSHINIFLNKEEDAVSKLVKTLKHLLYAPGSEAQRLDDVLTDGSEWRISGFSEALATKCLAIVYPDSWIPLFVYESPNGKQAIIALDDVPLDPIDENGKSRGELATESNRVLFELLETLIPDDSWGKSSFLWWLLERSKTTDVRIIRPVEGLKDLADELLLSPGWLEEVVELLEDKKQIIFYGPPGTGKTFVARRLAKFLAPEEERRKVVQFHPSYSYEDFIWGYRPLYDEEHHVLRYKLTNGPLKALAETASEAQDKARDRYLMLIDEINRGNVAKVFGELYYLLEYRDDEIQLQYSSDNFALPSNLYIIGTMNTADRSIGVLDAALRRRFHFIEFYPDAPPIDGLLRRWLKTNKPEMEFVADLVPLANSMLHDRSLQIGPSYFMRPNLDERWLQLIWQHSVLPYIEEQYYDEPHRVAQFDLARLRAKLPAADETGSESDAGSNQALSSTTRQRTIRLKEWKTRRVELTQTEVVELLALNAGLTIQPVGTPGWYSITPSSIVGVASHP